MNILNISHLISTLAQSNECVTMPGFGAFVVNPAAARIDVGKNMFLPPGSKISFNKKITNNDGLLASALAEKEGISYEDAVVYLKGVTHHIQLELDTKGHIDFEPVGTFFQSNGILRFEPSNIESSLGLGLAAFRLTPLDAQEMGKEAIIAHPAAVKTEIKYIEKTSSWGKVGWAVAMIPFIAYLVWVPSNSGVLQGKRFQFSDLNPFKATPCEEYTPRPVGVGLQEIDLQANDLLHADYNETDFHFAVPETTNVVLASTIVSAPIKYQIIGGCFSDKANASRLVSKLQDQGYDARIFDKKGNLYRVTYGGFSHQKDARKMLKKVKANANASAWLYKMK